jgi:4-oxalocrotonate tautomerase
MPYVNVQILKGATKTQKKQLVEDITRSLVERLGKKPEHIHIVIQQVDEEDWGYMGMLTSDWKKQHKAPVKAVKKK